MIPATISSPLTGVRVIDLTTFLSGPFATQVLADLGADVIKIETPSGDSTRHLPPHFVGEDSAYFLSVNRNKRSVVLDLKVEKDLGRLHRLIATADVVVDNYRPGVLTRLGLDPERLIGDQPGLIWASISGFGRSGADSARPAYDMIVQAMSGVMSLTGHPGHPSVRLGIPAGDTVAGLYATIGVLAALADVRAGGAGRWVDVSMLDAQLNMLSYQAVYALMSGVAPQPQGAGHDSIPTYRAFVAGDGEQFVVTANTEAMWQGLCRAIEREDLISDQRFENASLRLANKVDLWQELEGAFATKSANDWLAVLAGNDVPCAPIRDVLQALDEARSSDRGMVLSLSAPGRGKFDGVDTPIRFVGGAAADKLYPPRLGEHQDAPDLPA